MSWQPSAVAFVSVACLWGAAREIPEFVDIAEKAGLTDIFYCGDDESKKYIIEALGNGVALIDYDNDGFPDVFLVTGSRLGGFPPGEEPTNQLYHNNRDGTFTKVTREAGLALSGWGQGVCAGDYDNDGNIDLFVTYFGKNHLYRNNGRGGFVDVTKEAGLDEDEGWSTGWAFLDYDRVRQVGPVCGQLHRVRTGKGSSSRGFAELYLERRAGDVRSEGPAGRK